MSRVSNTMKNLRYSFIGQIFSLLISFLTRTVFIRFLSAEYLGLNGTFSSLLTVLSVAELGIGNAIVYSLYKPLADNDFETVRSVMALFKRLYTVVGIIVMILGLITSFFLEKVVSAPDIAYVHLIYLLFVTDSSVSYFFSYKTALIEADQKLFLVSKYRYTGTMIQNLVKMIYLYLSSDFIGFMMIQIVFNTVVNAALALKADKMYPYLKNSKNVKKLEKKLQKQISRNAKATFIQKVGEKIINGTDNILLSAFLNLSVVGIYSNYLLITGAAHKTIDTVFQAVAASVGNLGATQDNRKIEHVFNTINFVGIFFACFGSVYLFEMINIVIEIWIGKVYLLDTQPVFLIAVIFFITVMRKPLMIFHSGLGLYWHDRYKPFLEAVSNFFISAILVKSAGISGILMGTVISGVAAGILIEPAIVYHYGFSGTLSSYYFIYLKAVSCSLASALLAEFIKDIFNFAGLGLAVQLLATGAVCTILLVFMSLLLFGRDRAFHEVMALITKRKEKYDDSGKHHYTRL